MDSYGVRTVEKLLQLPRSTIRGLIEAGFVAPARGPRGALLFSFQDLIALRAAWSLSRAGLPHRRIIRSLKQLRGQLPDSMPLSGLRIGAVGDRVVVHEGDARWQADSGQYLLALEVETADGVLSVVDRREQAKADAEEWFSHGAALEETDPEAAQRAYEAALTADPAHCGAATNLGRLLHAFGRLDAAERVYLKGLAACRSDAVLRYNLGRLLHAFGRLDAAERVYLKGLAACRSDAVLRYNLGVLLEDTGRIDEAVRAYEHALSDDSGLADCHYNLARLYQAQGRAREAIRHLARYRRLAGDPD